MEVNVQARKDIKTRAPTVQKGPVEGMILVDGRPQMEFCDMPTISFDSIVALQRANNKEQ